MKSRGVSGASLGALERLLGRSWAVLGALGALLGRSWALLGRSERDKKRKKHGFLPPLLLLGRFWPCLGASWPHLGASRAHLEGSLAVFWYQSLHNLSSCLFCKTLQRMVPIVAKVHIIIGFEAATRFPGTWVGISIDLPPRLAGNLLGVRCSSSWQQSLGTPRGAAVSAKRSTIEHFP